MDIKLHILHDDRQPQKLPLLLNELSSQGITNYEIVPAIIEGNKTVVESINAGHKSIVRRAKEQGLPCVAIAEDDISFTAPDAWQYFLNQMPKEFDVYLACSYIRNLVPNTGDIENLICGFHLYILNSSYYDAFLSVPDKEHIDVAVGDLKGNFVFCKPFPCLQRAGFSANNPGEPVNYNGILKSEDIYIG